MFVRPRLRRKLLAALLAAGTLVPRLTAEIYSPKLLRAGQPDSTDLKKFADAICANARATKPRDRAEAIWRFFLTDGRFVKPGFWYHIAGWAYEEPSGEVLDPIKLLNSYGFGLCYHIAPLLTAVFQAAGFADARCWFLTGHTVAEVFYDGAYHYFDSDMMGYNVAGSGPFRSKPVVSVRDMERDGDSIVLGKLTASGTVKQDAVDYPWYPADVHAHAMPDLVNLFTTTSDNYLYPYTRYSLGNSMDWALRTGESLIRYFAPEEPGLAYLPYKWDGQNWSEFPQDAPAFHVRVAEGPHSEKDYRSWATGRIEYTPKQLASEPLTVIDMPSPYVIIDAQFTMQVDVSPDASLQVETSTDGGHTWTLAGKLSGPYQGRWVVEPALLSESEHGRLTAVSGTYGYRVRLARLGQASFDRLSLVSRIQVNPRSLPEVQPGHNEFVYSAADSVERIAVPATLAQAPVHNLRLFSQNGQDLLLPLQGGSGEAVYELNADAPLIGFDAGARFLDIHDLAPDKLTAETRHTGINCAVGPASLSWSLSRAGPFQPLWTYPQKLEWRDNDPIARLLLWPEVFQQVRTLPPGTKRVYVKFASSGPAIDSIRLAMYVKRPSAQGVLKVTQVWTEKGKEREHIEHFTSDARDGRYTITAGPSVENKAVIFSAE